MLFDLFYLVFVSVLACRSKGGNLLAVAFVSWTAFFASIIAGAFYRAGIGHNTIPYYFVMMGLLTNMAIFSYIMFSLKYKKDKLCNRIVGFLLVAKSSVWFLIFIQERFLTHWLDQGQWHGVMIAFCLVQLGAAYFGDFDPLGKIRGRCNVGVTDRRHFLRCVGRGG